MPDLHGEHVLVDVHVRVNVPLLLLVEVLVEVLTVFVCEYWPTVDLRLVGPRSGRPDLAAMHDIGDRGPQPAAEPRPAAISAGCGPFVPAFVAYDT